MRTQLRHASVIHVIGWLLVGLGAMMLIPMITDLFFENPDWIVFAGSTCIAIFVGFSLVLATWGTALTVGLHEGFIIASLTWIASGFIGSLPLILAMPEMTFAEAVFEAVSGITTTGSTVIRDLDLAPPGVLMWRALLQWMGGIGFVAVGLAVLPMLRVGGMRLFRLESSEKSDKVLPHAKELAVSLLALYFALTLLCTISLSVAGMSHFDALLHAMSTVSTGGFSTRDRSVGAFDSAAIDWIVIAFMIAGSTPFFVMLRALKGHPRAIRDDQQLRTLLGFLLAVALTIAGWLCIVDRFPVGSALTLATFHVVSLVTTTGFSTADYTRWGSLPVGAMFLLTFVGGCAGSTAGGVKIFRFQILWIAVQNHVRRLLSPNAVVPSSYNRRDLPIEEIASVLLYFGMFLLSTAIISVLLEAMGIDFLTSITGAATALANVGPGLGDIIGPTGTFHDLPDAAKWVLSIGMILGRLEFYTLLVLFAPSFWR